MLHQELLVNITPAGPVPNFFVYQKPWYRDGAKKSPIGNRDYPLTWEQDASEANYDGAKLLDPIYVRQKLSAPHTWHAAEVFLYVLSLGAR